MGRWGYLSPSVRFGAVAQLLLDLAFRGPPLNQNPGKQTWIRISFPWPFVQRCMIGSELMLGLHLGLAVQLWDAGFTTNFFTGHWGASRIHSMWGAYCLSFTRLMQIKTLWIITLSLELNKPRGLLDTIIMVHKPELLLKLIHLSAVLAWETCSWFMSRLLWLQHPDETNLNLLYSFFYCVVAVIGAQTQC